ncbi:MAG: 4-hydroxy-tetrahydrodipicolinate synthase [Bacteroidetes bacterium]|nr:4-hydroxy-tetrahydrodipicolinate synthase [Bacteroidota bacterium]
MKSLKGAGVAIVTPFLPSGQVDFSALESLTEFWISEGLDYLVVNGTTAENPVLSSNEKKEILASVLNVSQGRVPIVFGIGGNHTRALQEDLINSDLSGVTAILSVTPFYNKPNQQGLYSHFAALAELSPLPIILYNVPGRTGVNMSAETTLKLAKDFSVFCGIKEASGSMHQITRILYERPRDSFLVISGDDAITFPLLASGADGVISVVANAFPNRFSSMVHAAMAGEMAEAQEHHKALYSIMNAIFDEGSPAGIKEVMEHLNLCSKTVRPPLTPVSDSLANLLKRMASTLV